MKSSTGAMEKEETDIKFKLHDRKTNYARENVGYRRYEWTSRLKMIDKVKGVFCRPKGIWGELFESHAH